MSTERQSLLRLVAPWDTDADDPAPPQAPQYEGAIIADPEDVKTFLLAGHATVTLVSKATSQRFTYRVEEVENEEGKTSPVTHFVKLLTEPDNERGYSYIGHVFRYTEYAHGRKSKIGEGAPGPKAFRWFWRQVIEGGKKPADIGLEVWHEGRCGACGRKLTVPESIARGIGPECWARRGGR